VKHNLELQREVARSTEELRRANLGLERASKAKSLFLATMSHELRTPLNAILLYTELLAGDAEERHDFEGSEDLRKVQAAGQHLLATINGILDLSRIEAGAENLELSDQDVGLLLREVGETLRPLAEQRGNRLELELPPPPREFRTDPTKLKQVLMNLGGNACKFTRDGTISMSAVLSIEGLRIQVQDTGKGMSPDELVHIFRAFEQANEDIGKHYGGTGLGLTISRRLVELMGGRITVASTPGEGSIFTVDLPKGSPDPP
jgi:signal transduction histidine kinase